MQEDTLLDAQKFGSFVAALRKEHGMTQADLADKLQVTDKAVSRWERGVGLPDIATLTPLANALQVTVSELLQAEKSEDEPPAPQEAAADSTDLIPQNTEPQPNRKKRRFAIGVVIGCISLLFALALFLGYPAFPVQKFFFFFLPLCLCHREAGQDAGLALSSSRRVLWICFWKGGCPDRRRSACGIRHPPTEGSLLQRSLKHSRNSKEELSDETKHDRTVTHPFDGLSGRVR